MAIPTDLLSQLIAEINKDLSLAKKLYAQLKQEKLALEQKNISSLESITTEKITIITALNEHQLLRDNIQLQLGAELGFKGLKQIITKFNLAQHDELKTLLPELEQILQQIKNLTEINGNILAISQNQTNRIIDILYNRENTYYGENAKLRATGSSKFFTKA